MMDDLVSSLRGKLEIAEDGRLKIIDEQRFKEELLGDLVYNSNFSKDQDVVMASRWIIYEAARESGIIPSSIQSLYEYKGKGGFSNRTVPAINVRGLTYDVSRAVIRTAIKNNSSAFIFELAPTEMKYTDQSPSEYATSVIAASLREGYSGPLFLQVDHLRVSEKRYEEDKEEELENIKRVIREAILAGFYNIDLDTSTLVTLSKPTVREQQRRNFEVAAELAVYIRELEPEGITISLGGEIGEIGGKNSTEEELREYLNGFAEEIGKVSLNIKGLRKVAIQTGTTHGGVPLPDGTIAKVKLDFETLERLSTVAREEYGLAGCVQHGASTLPAEAFHRFPETGTAEVHLATEFQNMIYDSEFFPSDLRSRIYNYLRREHKSERKEGQTDEQFIYKTRKEGFGPFKKEIWDIPEESRVEIGRRLEDKFDFLFKKLNVCNTYDIVKKEIRLVPISRPIPEALKKRISND
ncbi:MAG: class II fructose-bisphosphate aldolase [bacterium]|nr:class II fructose-bisphosphate aldolase [bacterium]